MDFVAAGAQVRERLLPFKVGTYDHHYVQFNPVTGQYITVPAWVSASIIGSQFTASKDNPMWGEIQRLIRLRNRFLEKGQTKSEAHHYALSERNRQLLRNLDVGGSFYTKKNSYSQTHNWVQGQGGSTGLMNYYTGPLMARANGVSPASSTWPTLTSYDVQMLSVLQMGGAAIAATVPTAPVTSLANFLGELYRDGIPDLIGRSIRRQGLTFESLSKEYLNYEFGWKPLVSDLRKFAKLVIKSNDLIKQYERDSGNNIARRHVFPPIVTTSISSTTPWAVTPPLRTATFASGLYQGPLTKTSVSTTEFWFSGTYSYFLNFGDDSRSRFEHSVSIAEKLLGFEITPEVVWNLAPWTWLVDWFVNIGDVFTNASAFLKDGLIMRRGYIMSRKSSVDTYTLDNIAFGIGGKVGRMSQSFGTVSKIRHRAYPFGFGLVPGVFTPRQWAILAALGITRSDIAK